MLTEYRIHKMGTAIKRMLWNALKFGTSREVNSKEGGALDEGWELAPPICSEVVAPQVELDGAVGEALIQQHPPQRPRTKLIFQVIFYDQFLD